jgi:uncharacterized damage-inducible protein DinB
MRDTDSLRKHVLELLTGKHAHADFDTAVAKFPLKRAGEKPAGAPYSAWQLLEHMRIAQRDILEFTRNPKHASPEWPEGYWPPCESPAKSTAWSHSVRAFRAELKAMMDLVADPARDLVAPIPHGQGQTLLREALLLADHNSYHVGQLVMLRRLLGAWKG